MDKVRYLCIQFTTAISPRQLAPFRSAVLRTVDPGQVLFHNHVGDGYRYSYPLIQYKRIGGRAAMVCLGDGVDAIYALFQRPLNTLWIGGEEMPFQIASINLKEYHLRVYDHLRFRFRLERWLPLNEVHYSEYRQKTDPADQRRFLESILRGNILSLAKGLNWHIDEEVKVGIQTISPPQAVPYKDIRLMAFQATFESNVFLPPYVGLGKGVSKGWGMVDVQQKNVKQNKSIRDGKRNHIPGGTAA